jgi:hypothetical protein
LNKPTTDHFISDEDVQRALDFLTRSAMEIGKLTEQAILAERLSKHVKALEMKRCAEVSAAAQEREAMASQAYLEAITREAVAAGELAKVKALREAASARIEAWRSAGANYRAMRL